MFSLLPLSFRFRGKVRRLFALYRCFLDHPGKGLHPTQISRHTGIAFGDVVSLLDRTPELFVRLPKRDGITRYRLASTITARQPEQVEQLLVQSARRESFVFYAFTGMLACLLLILVVLVAPAL